MSMKCPECTRTLQQAISNGGHVTDRALGVYTRRRFCACGYKTTTVEIQQAELADLRRRAFLFELTQKERA